MGENGVMASKLDYYLVYLGLGLEEIGLTNWMDYK